MGFIGFTFIERELLLGERTSSPAGLRFLLLLITEDRTSSYSFYVIRKGPSCLLVSGRLGALWK